jgi:hypothetical protein
MVSLAAYIYVYEQSEKAKESHTHEPRDVLLCVALSLLQKLLHYRGE